jgi:hypothetical protein
MAISVLSVASGQLPTVIVIFWLLAFDVVVDVVVEFEQPDAAEITSTSETMIAKIRFFMIFLLKVYKFYLPTAIPQKIAKTYYQSLAAKTARSDFVFLIL